MTDQERLSVKDYIDRMLYLTYQMKVTHSFAPIKVVGEADKPHILLGELADFEEIQTMYEIGDDEVIIRATDEATHYIYCINDSLYITYIEIKEKNENA